MKKFFLSFIIVLVSIFTGSAFAATVTCLKGENKSNCMSRVVREGHNPLVEKMNEIKRHPNTGMYDSFYNDYRVLSNEIKVNCSRIDTPVELDECIYMGQQKRMQVLKEELVRLKALSVTNPKEAAVEEKPNCNAYDSHLKFKECRKGKYREPQGGIM